MDPFTNNPFLISQDYNRLPVQNNNSNDQPRILTYPIQGKKNFNKLYNIVASWNEEAASRAVLDKSGILSDGILVGLMLQGSLDKILQEGCGKKKRVYVALSSDKTVQGIAMTKVGKKKIAIKKIMTNPNNFSLEGRPFKGAGTALITHICLDAMNKEKNFLQLHSTESAKPFYEKLGFTYLKQEDDFILNYERMHQLVTAKKIDHKISEHEEKLKKQKNVSEVSDSSSDISTDSMLYRLGDMSLGFSGSDESADKVKVSKEQARQAEKNRNNITALVSSEKCENALRIYFRG